jgi:hypothetical protein
MPTATPPRPGWVLLGDTTVNLERLRSGPAQHPRLFEQARTNPGHGRCLCTNTPLRLVIRLRAGRYHLAGWPGEGTTHDQRCAFFKLAPELSGSTAYSRAAIQEDGEGFRITLRQPLELREGEHEPAAAAEAAQQTTNRNAVSLLGLLHWAWEQGGLNRWHPSHGPRHWRHVNAEVTAAARTSTLNRQPLDQALHVISPYTPQTASLTDWALGRFTSALTSRPNGRRRGLLLAELRGISATKSSVRLALGHTRRPVFVPTALMNRTQTSYRSAFAAARPEHARRIALLLVEATSLGNLAAVDLCVMLTSRHYIPADSSHEVLAADLLVDRGRAFVKPCRFDAGEAVLPDFVLTDTGTHLSYLEVWGIAGREEYEARRRAKEAYYRRAGAHLIGWDVNRTRLADLQLPPASPGE